MPIQKQEFYEGAALHLLARAGLISGIRYESPFFAFNDEHFALLKFCARSRSPWGFTFTPEEQRQLHSRARQSSVTVALICGADGIAAVGYEAYATIAPSKSTSLHIACYRAHGEHYEVNGPDGTLPKKIAPSHWQRILQRSCK